MNTPLKSRIITGLVYTLDDMLPKSIRMNREITSLDLAKARGMVAILLASIILPLLVLFAYVFLQLATKKNFSHDIIAVMLVEVVLVSQHIYFQSYGNLRVTAAAYSLQYLLTITGVIVISGGWDHSPLLILLVCSPLIAAMTMGMRSALYHVLLVFIVISSLFLINMKHIPLPIDIGRPERYEYTRFIAASITLVFIAIFLVFNDKLTQVKLEKE